MFRRGGSVLFGFTVLMAIVLAAWQYFNGSDIAHQSIQLWLKIYGGGIYEYHAKTGQWPSRIDDLAKTSLPAISRYWKESLDTQTFVIVWHKNLKTDPKDNATVILAYHKKGLYSQLGRTWVCWGDLRTDYLKTEDLRARLQTRDD
jgi:hypothetical protein